MCLLNVQQVLNNWSLESCQVLHYREQNKIMGIDTSRKGRETHDTKRVSVLEMNTNVSKTWHPQVKRHTEYKNKTYKDRNKRNKLSWYLT